MFRGMSLSSLLVLLLIVVVLFGTKRLRDIGGDLGAAVRSFRKGVARRITRVNRFGRQHAY